MKWYDMVAPLYDRAISRTYLPYRQIAVQALHLQPCLTVMDIGCGTGLNFALILNAIGTQSTLIGINSSTKMLNRARQKVDHRSSAPFDGDDDHRETDGRMRPTFHVEGVNKIIWKSIWTLESLRVLKAYNRIEGEGEFITLDTTFKVSFFDTAGNEWTRCAFIEEVGAATTQTL